MRRSLSTALITFAVLILVLTGVVLYVFLHGITPDLTYPETFTYTYYTNDAGELSFVEQKVREGDELYDNLIKLLDKHSKGWKPDFNTYVPNHYFTYVPNHYFSSDDLTINVLRDTVVINYAPHAGSRHWQVLKSSESIESVLGQLEQKQGVKPRFEIQIIER